MNEKPNTDKVERIFSIFGTSAKGYLNGHGHGPVHKRNLEVILTVPVHSHLPGDVLIIPAENFFPLMPAL